MSPQKQAFGPQRDRSARTSAPAKAPVRPAGPAAHPLLALQRRVGNAAVVQLLQQNGRSWAQPEQHQHGAGCGHQQPVQRSAVHDVLRGSGQPLDGATRADMEARLGSDFSDVRVHTDSAAKASAAEVGARAYTSGNHVVIGEGGGDKHTLAHELTHVIQQRQGPVSGTDTGSGLRVSDPADRFEREAEANARQVMSGPVTAQRTVEPTAAAQSAQSAQSAHQQVPVVARMMAGEPATPAKPWPVFGVDGRSPEQLASAVAEGYRRFDTAESYNNTPAVAAALQHLPRNNYEVIYKFDTHTGESAAQLTARLHQVAALFGGRLDALIIHNLDVDRARLRTAWQVLNQLKQEGVAAQIGLGNVGEAHAGLLAELGGVDVVENSVESVLLSENVQEAIRASGAHLYYYDVIRTAGQMGLDPRSPADLKALIYRMSAAFSHPRTGDSQATMITSSGAAATRQANLENFGDGPDHEDFDGYLNEAGMVKISAWQTQQASGQVNDANFTLPAPVKAWLVSLIGDAADVRRQLTAAAQQGGQQLNQAFIEQWLINQGLLTAEDLRTVRVPCRMGLKRRYIGMALPEVLAALFGAKNCDWKWSFELVQLMSGDIDYWNTVLQPAADEIVHRTPVE